MGTTVSAEWVDHGERHGRQGRKFVPTERRRELVAAFGESGLTRTEFARREGIKYTTLCNWVQREGKGTAQAKAATTMRFAEVALPASVGRRLEVQLADGTTLRGGRVEELAALVRALRA
jgi:transposase-like protein